MLVGLLGCAAGRTLCLPRSFLPPIAGENGEKGADMMGDASGLTMEVSGVGEEGLGWIGGGGVTEEALGETRPDCNGEAAGDRT